jgi:hypothetical protein
MLRSADRDAGRAREWSSFILSWYVPCPAVVQCHQRYARTALRKRRLGPHRFFILRQGREEVWKITERQGRAAIEISAFDFCIWSDSPFTASYAPMLPMYTTASKPCMKDRPPCCAGDYHALTCLLACYFSNIAFAPGMGFQATTRLIWPIDRQHLLAILEFVHSVSGYTVNHLESILWLGGSHAELEFRVLGITTVAWTEEPSYS